MIEELYYLSATEALDLFRKKKLSPVELLQAQIERHEQIDPGINAFTDTFFESALEQAHVAEAKYAKGSATGLLEGITTAMKDEIDVEGQRNTEGSLLHEQRIASEDAILVSRLRNEGAIFHARTTCPEFCSLWNTQSRLFGVTRNPWNLEVTPGGSSGGAGAALAAGTTTLATGSDIGGSIRYPASMCGVVGFKPPFGRIPDLMFPFNLDVCNTNGPMARTVADTILMQNVMSGVHPADAASTLPDIDIPTSTEQSLRGIRIAFTIDFGYLEVEPDVVSNTLAMLDRLRDLGAELVEVPVEWFAEIDVAYNAHLDQIFGASMAGYMEQQRDLMCDYNVQFVERSLASAVNPMNFYQSMNVEAQSNARFGLLMQDFDVFVCPTVNSNQLAADFNPVHDQYVVNNKVQELDLAIANCHYFNLMGRCPALSIPSGIGENGVPTGLQIAAAPFEDVAVFRIASILENTGVTGFQKPVL